MKDARESGVNTSVADWKPCTREEFDRLLHHYATSGGDEHGNGGIIPKSYMLDRHAKVVIWAFWPKLRSVGSPVLMTMTHGDGHPPLTFASLRYGVNAPSHLAYRTHEGDLTELGAGRASPQMPQDSSDPSLMADRRVPLYADEQRPKAPGAVAHGGPG